MVRALPMVRALVLAFVLGLSSSAGAVSIPSTEIVVDIDLNGSFEKTLQQAIADGSIGGGGGGSGTITAVGTACTTGACYTTGVAQNAVFAGPSSGTGSATMRALVEADLPLGVLLGSELDNWAKFQTQVGLVGCGSSSTVVGGSGTCAQVGVSQIDATTVQRRVSGTCPGTGTSNAAGTINQDGTVTCVDLEEETHASEHAVGGADPVPHDTLQGYLASKHHDTRVSATCTAETGWAVQGDQCQQGTGPVSLYCCTTTTCNAAGWVACGDGSGSGSPGGSSGQVQYNNGGSFAGIAGSVVDGSGNVTLPGSLTLPGPLDVTGSVNGRKGLDLRDNSVELLAPSNKINFGECGLTDGELCMRRLAGSGEEVLVRGGATAGGGLTGTYPNPTVASVNASAVVESQGDITFDTNNGLRHDHVAVDIVSGDLTPLIVTALQRITGTNACIVLEILDNAVQRVACSTVGGVTLTDGFMVGLRDGTTIEAEAFYISAALAGGSDVCDEIVTFHQQAADVLDVLAHGYEMLKVVWPSSTFNCTWANPLNITNATTESAGGFNRALTWVSHGAVVHFGNSDPAQTRTQANDGNLTVTQNDHHLTIGTATNLANWTPGDALCTGTTPHNAWVDCYHVAGFRDNDSSLTYSTGDEVELALPYRGSTGTVTTWTLYKAYGMKIEPPRWNVEGAMLLQANLAWSGLQVGRDLDGNGNDCSVTSCTRAQPISMLRDFSNYSNPHGLRIVWAPTHPMDVAVHHGSWGGFDNGVYCAGASRACSVGQTAPAYVDGTSVAPGASGTAAQWRTYVGEMLASYGAALLTTTNGSRFASPTYIFTGAPGACVELGTGAGYLALDFQALICEDVPRLIHAPNGIGENSASILNISPEMGCMNILGVCDGISNVDFIDIGDALTAPVANGADSTNTGVANALLIQFANVDFHGAATNHAFLDSDQDNLFITVIGATVTDTDNLFSVVDDADLTINGMVDCVNCSGSTFEGGTPTLPSMSLRVNDLDYGIVDQQAEIRASADIGTDLCIRVGDRDQDANASCICRDAGDRLYGDLNCGGTKDGAEEFIDQAPSGGSPHNMLSATHSDSAAASAVRGDLMIANSSPAWSRLPIGGVTTFLKSNGTDPAWAAITLGTDTTGDYVASVIAGIGLEDAGTAGEGSVPDLRLSYGALATPNITSANHCAFGTPSGIICEGTVSDAQEQLHLFPAQNGADTTDYIAAADSTGACLAGDTATAFFTAGQLETARGGTGQDISGYTAGLLGLAASAVIDVDTEAELETAAGNGTPIEILTSASGDFDSAALRAGLSDETGTGIALFNDPQAIVLDVEAGTNSITIVDKAVLKAGACRAAVASLNFDDDPGKTEPAAGCFTEGTTEGTTMGVADFDAAGDEGFQITLPLPAGWTGAVDLVLVWVGGTGSANTVDWNVQTRCTADAETYGATFNAVQSIIDAGKGTANQRNATVSTALTTTGCAAGEDMTLRIFRDADDATNDTYAADARLISAELTIRRAQ